MPKAVAAAIACALCMSLGLATSFMGTLPVFLQPVSAELGWGAAIYPQAALVAGMVSALIGPLVGHLIDRFGVRPATFVGLVGFAGLLAAFSMLNGSQVQMLMLAAGLGIASAACGPIPLAKVVAGWFDRNRGLAFGLVLSAAPAIATATMLIVANDLIADHGWRATYQILGAVVICLAFPVAFVFLHEAPSDPSSAAHEDGAYVTASVGETLRNGTFWLVLALTGLICGTMQAVVTHFLMFSAEQGVSHGTATAALSAFSLAGPLGPLLSGVLADRTRSPRALIVFYSLPFIGLALLVTVGNSVAIAAMVLAGIGFQAATGMLPYLLTRYFGVKHASQLFGWGWGVVILSMGLAPVILGFARDRLNGFSGTIPALFVSLSVAIALVFALPRHRQLAPGDVRPSVAS